VGVAGKRAGKGIVYFEIRHGGRTLDARSWLNVK
jgi:septal ring factor EnvC (AmiA/AmiB activator)